MRRFSRACMSNIIALGCLEADEKFPGGVGWWWGHFHSKNYVTPTLGKVRLRLGWAVTIDIGIDRYWYWYYTHLMYNYF